MLHGDRDQIRRQFCTSWAKFQKGLPLEPMEQIIATIISNHPEYQALLADEEASLAWDNPIESGTSNPFMHMGMHIAITEQLTTDRPAGIMQVYPALCSRFGGQHEAEHQMMNCLGETLWEAQREDRAPDENLYLQRLRKLIIQPGQ